MHVRYAPTPSQRKVLALVCEGRTNKEIGRVLGISPSTVKGHLKLIRDDLSFNSVRSRSRTFLALTYKRWLNGENIPGWNLKPNEV